jgi:apolipoprotein D and lipocalin family protein
MKLRFVLTALCFAVFNAQADDAAVIGKAEPAPVLALSPVVALDVPRYMGLWYEIAKYPNWFQRNCVAATRAEYSLQADGRVQVLNRCQLASGELNQATGVARQVGEASSAMLEVRFAPAWLSFIPAVWGDYWVIDIDDAYQLVAVSEPGRKYLWVLSRTPAISPRNYADLLARLASKGFDVSRLELTRQDGAALPK